MGGDFIEIIAFVIGLFWFIFRSNKKKEEKAKDKRQAAPQRQRQARPQPTSSAPQKEESLEDIFREIIRQQQGSPSPPPKPKIIEVKEEETPFHLTKRKASRTRKEEKVPKVVLEEDEKYEPAMIERVQGKYVDLRQAIIHEAILKRPYQD